MVPTLIAGVYGMNFTHMPELGWAYGYPFALALMVGTAAALLCVQALRLALAAGRRLGPLRRPARRSPSSSSVSDPRTTR